MYDKDVLKGYLEIANKTLLISGITPSSSEFKTITCPFYEWTMCIAMMTGYLEQIGLQLFSQSLMGFLNAPFRDYTDNISRNAGALLQKEQEFHDFFDRLIQEWRDMFSQFGMTLDINKTHLNITNIFTFLRNNPGGIEGNFMQSQEEKILQTTPTEAIRSTPSTQKLIGINPINSKGKELLIDAMHFRIGFYSICSFYDTANIRMLNPVALEITLALGENALSGRPIEVDPDHNGLICSGFDTLLNDDKGKFLTVVERNWTNPQIIQYNPSNTEKFDKKSFLKSMKKLSEFMKSNQGFKS